jgi:hypothetical protein
MKFLIMITLVVLMVAAMPSSGHEKVTRTEQLVREMDSKLMAGLLQGDSASVDGILADEYIEINSQGLVRHKSDIMLIVRARASAPRSISVGPEITVDETIFRGYGNTAIFISLITTRYQHMEYQTLPQSSQLPAPSATSQERVMKVYSSLNGRWHLVATQTTAIAKH